MLPRYGDCKLATHIISFYKAFTSFLLVREHRISRLYIKNPLFFTLHTSDVLTKYYPGDQIKKNETGKACSTYWGEERCIQSLMGNLRVIYQLKDPGLDERIVLRMVFRKWNGGHGLDLSGSGYGQMAGTCKHGNEHSGPLTFRNLASYI